MSSDWPNLIDSAMRGDEPAWRTIVEQLRPHLRQAAARQLAERVRRRVDPSDIVQQSLLEAWNARGTFAGLSKAELVAWLGRIVERNLQDTVRQHIGTDMRTVDRERSLDELRSSGAARPDVFISAELSPRSLLARREALGRLARFLDDLPPRQRQAVRMRYIERRTLNEIAVHFALSENAAAQLLARGLSNLRRRHEQLKSPSS
jgi:RNA polymerase sigma-70 factor (ECF subfamily)